MKQSLVMILLLPLLAQADDKEDYRSFLQQIDTAQEKIDYSERLISLDDLDGLMTDPNQPEKNKPGINTRHSYLDRARALDPEGLTKVPHEPVPTSTDPKPESSTAQPAQETPVREPVKPAPVAAQSAPVVSEKPTKPVTAAHKQPKPKPKPKVNNVPGVYISPALANIGNSRSGDANRIRNNIVSTVPKERKVTYGITIGTRINVVLDTAATNVQPGYVQFKTTQDIVGYKKTLPRNTRFFGKPSSVIGSDKLFVNVSNGLDSSNQSEFTLSGIIYDDQGAPGLAGYVINDGRAIERAADAGSSALASGLVELVPGNVATDAAKASANQLIRDQRAQDRVENGRPRYIVEAGPQDAVLQIERTF